MGFFDLTMHGGGPTRPAACKIFIFDNNDYIFGTNNIKVKVYPTKEKKLTLVQNDDDVSTLKKMGASDWLILKLTSRVKYLRYKVG